MHELDNKGSLCREMMQENGCVWSHRQEIFSFYNKKIDPFCHMLLLVFKQIILLENSSPQKAKKILENRKTKFRGIIFGRQWFIFIHGFWELISCFQIILRAIVSCDIIVHSSKLIEETCSQSFFCVLGLGIFQLLQIASTNLSLLYFSFSGSTFFIWNFSQSSSSRI